MEIPYIYLNINQEYLEEIFNLIKIPDENLIWATYWLKIEGLETFAREVNLSDKLRSIQLHWPYSSKDLFIGTSSRVVCIKKNEKSITVYSINYDKILDARYIYEKLSDIIIFNVRGLPKEIRITSRDDNFRKILIYLLIPRCPGDTPIQFIDPGVSPEVFKEILTILNISKKDVSFAAFAFQDGNTGYNCTEYSIDNQLKNTKLDKGGNDIFLATKSAIFTITKNKDKIFVRSIKIDDISLAKYEKGLIIDNLKLTIKGHQSQFIISSNSWVQEYYDEMLLPLLSPSENRSKESQISNQKKKVEKPWDKYHPGTVDPQTSGNQMEYILGGGFPAGLNIEHDENVYYYLKPDSAAAGIYVSNRRLFFIHMFSKGLKRRSLGYVLMPVYFGEKIANISVKHDLDNLKSIDELENSCILWLNAEWIDHIEFKNPSSLLSPYSISVFWNTPEVKFYNKQSITLWTGDPELFKSTKVLLEKFIQNSPSKPISKTCPNCGNTFGDKANFCKKCGSKRMSGDSVS